MQEGKEEPSAEYASAVGSEENIDVMETKYNTNIYDFMQKLPGITSKNIDIIMRNVKNLDEMIKLNKVGSKFTILLLCNFIHFRNN